MIWQERYVPTQDGALHLYNAVVLRDYERPDRQIFRDYFSPNRKIVPNMICPQALPLITRLVSAPVAEKLLLSFYLIALPAGVWYALGGIDKRAKPLALIAAAWGLNQVFYYGFQDFCISLVGYFLVTGWWLRNRQRFGPGKAVLLATFLLILYLTHLLSVVMVLPLIGLTALSAACAQEKTLASSIARLVPVMLAMLPVLLLAAWFAAEPHGVLLIKDYPVGWHQPRFLVDWMQGLLLRERWPDLLVTLLLVIGSLFLLGPSVRDRESRPMTRAMGALVIFYFLTYLISPDAMAGGRVILTRVAAFPSFAILLWWATVPLSARQFKRLLLAAGFVGIIATSWIIHLQSQRSATINFYLAEYDAIPPLIPPGSTLLPTHYEQWLQADLANIEGRGSGLLLTQDVDPFRHAEARGLAERGIIDLANHWASTDHHSVVWNPGCDPMTQLIDTVDNFAGYALRTGHPVDYVLVRAGGIPHTDAQAKAIARQLEEGYQKIYASPSGNLTLYRRLPIGPH
jgi:hypothetical protein